MKKKTHSCLLKKNVKIENYLKIEKNLWKCLPKGKCNKFIKNKIFDDFKP